MTVAWTPKETTVHQDHVIAHVLDTTVLGYFIHDEALYILLDIGFVWSILLDGEMGLLPHPVAVSELEIDEAVRERIKKDIDSLLSGSSTSSQLQLPPTECQIKDVGFFSAGDKRRFVIAGEEPGEKTSGQQRLAIEMSLATNEVKVMATEETGNDEAQANASEEKLDDVARTEHEYLHQRLRDELGREPTEAELDEWLRQHTEGY